jgi:DNA-binding protein H-NS
VAQQPQGSLTQKQRQNASKREAQKSAKAAAEAERLATLAKHKNELERIRIIEQSRSSKKGKTSGGMTSVVDDRGKLVWE